MDDEHADGEKADECAEVGPRCDAAVSGVNFCIENGDNHDADEDAHHAVRHDFHHAFLRAVDVGVLLEFGFHGRPCGEHDEAVDEVSDRGPEGGQCNAGVVHGHTL